MQGSAASTSRMRTEEEDTPPPKRQKLSRNSKVCQFCRSRKAKCEPDKTSDGEGGARCQRCREAGIECVPAVSNRRRAKSPVSLTGIHNTLKAVLSAVNAVPPASSTPAGPGIDGSQLAALQELNRHLASNDAPFNSQVNAPFVFESALPPPVSAPTFSPESFLGPGAQDQLSPDEQRLLEQAFAALTRGDAAPEPSSRSFMVGPLKLPTHPLASETRSAPQLLIDGVISAAEAVTLFEMFFSKLSRQVAFLSPELHTAHQTAVQSPFLFTCICTVSARYYTVRPALYAACLSRAILLASTHLVTGEKSISIVQGYLLLSHWNQPVPDGVHAHTNLDRTYTWSGMATRMMLELGYPRKPKARLEGLVGAERLAAETDERNKERTWIRAVVTEKSLSMQMGRPSILPADDPIIFQARTWPSQTGAVFTDTAICSVVQLHKILWSTLDLIHPPHLAEMDETANFPHIVRHFLAQLRAWEKEYGSSIGAERHVISRDDEEWMRNILIFYSAYYQLFVISFAVKSAFNKPGEALNLAFYVSNCYENACTIARMAVDYFGPRDHLRYAMDSTLIYIVYCCLFLLKLVNPTTGHLIDTSHAIGLVNDVADALERSAIDAAHTPILYASLLRSLVTSKLSGERTQPQTRVSSPSHTTPAVTERAAPTPAAASAAAVSGFDPVDSYWNNMHIPGFDGFTLSGGMGTMSDVLFDAWDNKLPHESSRAPSPSLFGFNLAAFLPDVSLPGS